MSLTQSLKLVHKEKITQVHINKLLNSTIHFCDLESLMIWDGVYFTCLKVKLLSLIIIVCTFTYIDKKKIVWHIIAKFYLVLYICESKSDSWTHTYQNTFLFLFFERCLISILNFYYFEFVQLHWKIKRRNPKRNYIFYKILFS